MTLLAGVLLASLLGSVHCGAMCSAFACLANGNARRGAWYHGGRLAAYVMLGTTAGLLGAGLDRAGLIANVQRAAMLVTSVTLIAWGLVQVTRALRARRTAASAPWSGTLVRLVTRTSAWDPRARAAAIGVTTAFLPCGWLWAFVATAMGTGSPLRAAAVMGVFWLGTVPMLVAVAAGARRWGPIAQVRWPLASASLVLALGVGELATHLLMPPMTLAVRDVMHTGHAAR
ncbi:MAG TPA: sulfite exporter TauE/SafE family protein [Gemmatimonadaceae bacterium]|nr:sulfite exporter TauE/SafE family protein [Gemmatimonadaceae bacterium]